MNLNTSIDFLKDRVDRLREVFCGRVAVAAKHKRTLDLHAALLGLDEGRFGW